MFRLIFPLLTLFVLLAPQGASAFVPDDEELAAGLQKTYGPLSSWQAEMTFPDYPGVSVSIWYARGKWRQEWKSGAKAVGIGENISGACTAGPFAMSPLFVWMPPRAMEKWQSWGIDTVTRNFGFCGDAPCLMLGAGPGDDATPAVQLNNESYAPVLLRYQVGARTISVVYGDYTVLGGFPVPGDVRITADGQTLDARVKWIKVNQADGEELYARDALDTSVCVDPPAPFDFLRDHFSYPTAR